MKPPAKATIASVAAIGSSAITPDMKVRMFIAHLQGCLAGRAPAEILTRHIIASAVRVGRNRAARSPRCQLFATWPSDGFLPAIPSRLAQRTRHAEMPARAGFAD